MPRIMSRLENLARSARARVPSPARVWLDRIEDAYRAARGLPDLPRETAVSQPAPVAAPAVAEPPAAPKRAINWELRSQAEIVDHIVDHYHAGLRRDLPTLIEAARKVEREHGGHASVPAGLTDTLEAFAAELDSHMLKEETMLFPTLREGKRGGGVDMPMRMMEREHEGHDAQLEKIRELTGGYTAPADASPTWTELYTGLETLENDLHQHIYLENNVLFVRASGGERD
jgi:regulator of cell morphogenesis and NO signaling